MAPSQVFDWRGWQVELTEYGDGEYGIYAQIPTQRPDQDGEYLYVEWRMTGGFTPIFTARFIMERLRNWARAHNVEMKGTDNDSTE